MKIPRPSLPPLLLNLPFLNHVEIELNARDIGYYRDKETFFRIEASPGH